jgi:hypothetical protein
MTLSFKSFLTKLKLVCVLYLLLPKREKSNLFFNELDVPTDIYVINL